MTWSTWLAFFVASWLISFTPGAGAISCMSVGMRQGYRRALWNIAGLELGIALLIAFVPRAWAPSSPRARSHSRR